MLAAHCCEITRTGDIHRLRESASQEGRRRATRVEAVSAHLWKLFSRLVADSGDIKCRMAWLVEGRRRMKKKNNSCMQNYIGNVITFAIREMSTDELANSSLAQITEVVSATTKEVAKEEHFQEMVDWMEENKIGAEANGWKR
ncbi:spermidine coumaroyl-CoA acyltransferase-like [Canna indica]|uniref:Spermidine coumaroyl-CoA acyltransferase-like n=1 Tax=Canna indica TaxID=4628 RepID=A0AAQ3JW06_9LILI|nr:spermidine coumaroyl-CoA acyltransferase-like [Canna indica]